VAAVPRERRFRADAGLRGSDALGDSSQACSRQAAHERRKSAADSTKLDARREAAERSEDGWQ
jgi:hypothetical protein